MLFDVHGHPPRDRGKLDVFLKGLARFDLQLVLSDLGSRSAGWLPDPPVAHWQDGNALVAELVRAYPERLLGYCYVNPRHTRDALDEMERRLLRERGVFAGLKLWQAVRCSDPLLDPLMEFCAAHDVPVLQHTFMVAGRNGAGTANGPGESTPDDLRRLAHRHPRVRFFAAHTGGDWEWGVAALRHSPNVWLDISGGEALGGYMEAALRGVGAGRIVFATDVYGRSVPSQLAKVLGAGLSDADLERILWRNGAAVFGARLPVTWRERYK